MLNVMDSIEFVLYRKYWFNFKLREIHITFFTYSSSLTGSGLAHIELLIRESATQGIYCVL